MKERLQKILAASGVASRRACEKLIADGRISVNGEIVTVLGSVADLDVDDIAVDGQPVTQAAEIVYIALNKPLGVVSTCQDTHDRPAIDSLDLPENLRLYPVGRLDMDSSGLLLLTNDGAFAQQMTHPAFENYKTYLVETRGHVDEDDLAALHSGIELTDGKTLPARAEIIAYSPTRTRLKIAIREGKNRQIRRMLGALHHPVENLQRIAVGSLQMGNLQPGEWRYLSPEEAAALLEKNDI
jgi:23S rRNA pseudouridine2605 synthase